MGRVGDSRRGITLGGADSAGALGGGAAASGAITPSDSVTARGAAGDVASSGAAKLWGASPYGATADCRAAR
jgi:hypothetical protein